MASTANREKVVDAFLREEYARSGHMAATQDRIVSYALPIAWKAIVRGRPHIWVLDTYHTHTTRTHINAVKRRIKVWGYREVGRAQTPGVVMYEKQTLPEFYPPRFGDTTQRGW